MDDFDKKLLCVFAVAICFGVIIKWQLTYPTTIEGKIIVTKYYTQPPFPYTTVTFTSLGDNSIEIMLSGTAEFNIKTGSTYRITYSVPFWYMYAVPTEISLIS
jgi:hypothetical protein